MLAVLSISYKPLKSPSGGIEHSMNTASAPSSP